MAEIPAPRRIRMARAATLEARRERWRSLRLAGQVVASFVAVPLLGLAAMLPVSALFALGQGLFVPFLKLTGIWLVVAPLAFWMLRKASSEGRDMRALRRERKRAWREAF